MSRLTPRSMAVVSLALGAGLLAACGPEPVTAPTVPDALSVPAGNSPVLKVSATGVQIYTCQAKTDGSGGYEWAFKAPEATLFDSKHQEVGSHYAGPTWELKDGSKVVGMVKARADSPDSNAIPWLLLSVQSNEGKGALATATFIHRVNTSQGKAPTTGCDSSKVGTEARVDYSAEYYFYAP